MMLHAKIHRARITDKSVDYVGSMAIDSNLLDASGIMPNEKVLVANLRNGARFETYAIQGAAGSGTVSLNGAAAHLGEIGDLVIIMAYALVDNSEVDGWKPNVIFVDDNNMPVAAGWDA